MSVASERTPSAFGVYFYAVLMALFGALLGFVYMTTFSAQAFASQADYEAFLLQPAQPAKSALPAKIVKTSKVDDSEELDEPNLGPKPGDAYYIEGAVLSSRSWQAKREQLALPGTQSVAFSVGEINAWMAAKFRKGNSSTETEEGAGILVVPGVPNVGIADAGEIFINLPVTLTAFGVTDDYTVSVRCALEATQLKIRSVGVSCAKVPFPQILGAKLVEVLSRGYAATEEYQIIIDAFARADSIAVVGEQLVLKLR